MMCEFSSSGGSSGEAIASASGGGAEVDGDGEVMMMVVSGDGGFSFGGDIFLGEMFAGGGSELPAGIPTSGG
jgi:hypothetical protein